MTCNLGNKKLKTEDKIVNDEEEEQKIKEIEKKWEEKEPLQSKNFEFSKNEQFSQHNQTGKWHTGYLTFCTKFY